jgi:hypothetical protein
MFWPKSIADVKEGEFAIEGVALESRRVRRHIMWQIMRQIMGQIPRTKFDQGGQVCWNHDLFDLGFARASISTAMLKCEKPGFWL